MQCTAPHVAARCRCIVLNKLGAFTPRAARYGSDDALCRKIKTQLILHRMLQYAASRRKRCERYTHHLSFTFINASLSNMTLFPLPVQIG